MKLGALLDLIPPEHYATGAFVLVVIAVFTWWFLYERRDPLR